jgi:hypothetical protein
MPILLSAALLVYAAVALALGWWLSALVAPLVAWLLWRRHPRARFAAYVFVSVMAARAVLTASWPLGVIALSAIAALQLPAARRAWPRLTRDRPLR